MRNNFVAASNRSFNISTTIEEFDEVMLLVLKGVNRVDWLEENANGGFDIYTYASGDKKLPINLNSTAAILVAKDWLETAEYGNQPNVDGHCVKGFNVEIVDRAYDDPYCRITPQWMFYHK